VPCRKVYVWSHTEVSSLCILHNNTQLCLFGHRSQLQGELVIGSIYCHGDWTLEEWVVVFIPILVNFPNPLQSLPCGLSDPAPGEGQCLWGPHQARSWLLQLHLG
jgi:hypothetical protein